MILLQINGEALKYVDNLYALIGLGVISIVYIFTTIYNKNQDKRQTNKIIETFEKQNDKIIEKIEDLKESKNVLDSQASMDIINVYLTKSMLEIVKGVKIIIESDIILSDKSLYISKKSIIFEKIKNIIDSEIHDDIIDLGKIYCNNVKLSHYILELDTNELIDEITHKIFSNNKNDSSEIVDYIYNRFSQFIQSIELQLSK